MKNDWYFCIWFSFEFFHLEGEIDDVMKLKHYHKLWLIEMKYRKDWKFAMARSRAGSSRWKTMMHGRGNHARASLQRYIDFSPPM